VPEPVDLVVCAVSFISLERALPAALALAAPSAWLVALIKPQFEAGRAQVGKGGVVREAAIHAAACARIARWLSDDRRWPVIGVTPSPITGPKGNREFLIAARRAGGQPSESRVHA
jgi:23S rRNA (cytidine1920-2'-O)/16S rRNA (cytidine1409-2'-O)-methyltransferase